MDNIPDTTRATKMQMFVFFAAIAMFILAVTFLVFAKMNEKPTGYNIGGLEVESSFYNCMVDRTEIFGAYWCPHCADQKKILGDQFYEDVYFECENNKQFCIDKGVKVYPTFFINDKKHEGVLEAYEIVQFANCSMQD